MLTVLLESGVWRRMLKEVSIDEDRFKHVVEVGQALEKAIRQMQDDRMCASSARLRLSTRLEKLGLEEKFRSHTLGTKAAKSRRRIGLQESAGGSKSFQGCQTRQLEPDPANLIGSPPFFARRNDVWAFGEAYLDCNLFEYLRFVNSASSMHLRAS